MSEREIYHDEKIGYAISHGVDSLAVTFIVFLGGGVGPGRRINVICNRTNGKNPLFFYEKTNEIKIFVEKKKCINETKFVHLPSVMAVLIVFCRLYKQNMIIINNT